MRKKWKEYVIILLLFGTWYKKKTFSSRNSILGPSSKKKKDRKFSIIFQSCCCSYSPEKTGLENFAWRAFGLLIIKQLLSTTTCDCVVEIISFVRLGRIPASRYTLNSSSNNLHFKLCCSHRFLLARGQFMLHAGYNYHCRDSCSDLNLWYLSTYLVFHSTD